MKKNIAQVVVGLAVDGPFDYSIPEALEPKITIGMRVSIVFNHKKRLGIVVGFLEKSLFSKLNPIIDLLEESPSLNSEKLALTKMMAQHYGCSWGEAAEVCLPAKLRKLIKLDDDRQIKKISKPNRNYEEVLLEHISFQKQWPIINNCLKENLDRRESVIFLVPEYYLIEEVRKNIDLETQKHLIILDETVTEKEELFLWQSIYKKDFVIVLATRSGIFLPVNNLGCIIVYQEEDETYRQEQSPSFHAVEVARMRCRNVGAKLLLTGFLPRVESYQQTTEDKRTVVADDFKNNVRLVDMTNYNPQKSSIISFPLQNYLNKILENKERAVLLLNRRGFNMMAICNQCGAVVKCPSCQTALTHMLSKRKLVCRHCTYQTAIAKICPSCRSSYVRMAGTGIEKLQSELSRIYPQAKIILVDKETKKFPENFDICITTQAISRYLEKIQVELFAILDFDSFINRHDFRGESRAWSALIKMRLATKKDFLIQTKLSDHQRLNYFIKNDWQNYYNEQLLERKELSLPPFSQIIYIHIRSISEEKSLKLSQQLFQKLKEENFSQLEDLEAFPDQVARKRGLYRYGIMMKTNNLVGDLDAIKKIIRKARKPSGVIVTLSVDP